VIPPETIGFITLRTMAIPSVCLIIVGVSFFNTTLARFSFFVIPIAQRIAIRLGMRRRRRAKQR
jgi:hypothetical protein